jgi:outer membrane protein TolC
MVPVLALSRSYGRRCAPAAERTQSRDASGQRPEWHDEWKHADDAGADDAERKAMDASLDLKVAAMNAAKGRAKIDATAAVINEMVSQQKQMMAKMMGMHEQMMKGMKAGNEKSTDTHKEHHE